MSDAPETGSGFLVPVFGADLWWYVCHWHNNRTSDVRHSKPRHLANLIDDPRDIVKVSRREV